MSHHCLLGTSRLLWRLHHSQVPPVQVRALGRRRLDRIGPAAPRCGSAAAAAPPATLPPAAAGWTYRSPCTPAGGPALSPCCAPGPAPHPAAAAAACGQPQRQPGLRWPPWRLLWRRRHPWQPAGLPRGPQPAAAATGSPPPHCQLAPEGESATTCPGCDDTKTGDHAGLLNMERRCEACLQSCSTQH